MKKGDISVMAFELGLPFCRKGGTACMVLYDLWGYGGRFFFFTCLILYTLVCRVFHVMHAIIIVEALRQKYPLFPSQGP
jgi:hypothetical protein